MFRVIPDFPLYEMSVEKVIRHTQTKNIKSCHRGTSNIRLYQDGNEVSRKIDKLFNLTYPELVEGIMLSNRSKYRVRSDGTIYSMYEAKVIQPASTKDGYCSVALILDDGTTKSYLVHRLVAEAFLPIDNKRAYVNHIDGIKNNNAVENLEWCTASENLNHAVKTGLYNTKLRKVRLSFDTINWKEFDTIKDAASYLGCPVTSVGQCVQKNGKGLTTKTGNKFRCRGHIVEYI